MKILIAEDDALSRLILEKSVQKFGHECISAADGAEAWKLFQLSTPDVIISDLMMPGMDGLELCRRVRAESPIHYTYFIFLTALSDKPHLLAGIEAGADDYLAKPLDREELYVRLISASRVTSLHRQLREQSKSLEEMNSRLFEQSRTDLLTKLGNRLRLQEDLEVLRGRVARYHHTYCAVMCDIDFFKSYNDHHGHYPGDEVLRTVANTITKNLRRGDEAYRFGGEEFLIILSEQSVESAAIAAERLRQQVEALAIPHDARTPPHIVTISAGVASLRPDEEKTVEVLLRQADAALYRAKSEGRNRVEIASVGERAMRVV